MQQVFVSLSFLLQAMLSPPQQALPHEFNFIRTTYVWEADGHKEFP